MKTVYIESTVVSYYVARRTRDLIAAAHQEITSDQPRIICTPEELMET